MPVRGELMATVDGLARRQISGLLRLIAGRRTELRAASAALPLPRDLLALPRQRLDTYAERLAPALRAGLRDKRGRQMMAAGRLSPHTLARTVLIARERLGGLEARALRAHRQQLARDRARLDGVSKLLESLSYKNVLSRGYALVRDADGQPLRSAHGIQPGDALTIEFGDESRLAATAAGDGGPSGIGGSGESEPARPAPRPAPLRRRARPPSRARADRVRCSRGLHALRSFHASSRVRRHSRDPGPIGTLGRCEAGGAHPTLGCHACGSRHPVSAGRGTARRQPPTFRWLRCGSTRTVWGYWFPVFGFAETGTTR